MNVVEKDNMIYDKICGQDILTGYSHNSKQNK